MHTLTSQQTHAHVRTPPKGANLLFYRQMNITDWIVFLWYFIRKSTISMWLMMADMFVLSKLNYRINRHEKDIFNFCFISFVNRVLKIVSTCSIWCFSSFFCFSLIWTHSVPCYIFFSSHCCCCCWCCIVICVAHTCYFNVKIEQVCTSSVKCAYVYVRRMLSEEKQPNVRRIFITFVFPDQWCSFSSLSRSYHFLLVSVNVSVV